MLWTKKSKGGAPTHPAWYHNLMANPDTTIEVGTETIAVHAEQAEGQERERLFRTQVQRTPAFAEYEHIVAAEPCFNPQRASQAI